MKVIIQALSFLIFFNLLQGCANTHNQSAQMSAASTYTSGTPSNNYVYRGPTAAQAAHISAGR